MRSSPRDRVRRTGSVLRFAAALGAALAMLSCAAAAAVPAVDASSSDELANMSLEQLSNIRVTSVSRRAENLAVAAASVYVIRAEDIRRAGAHTLPEALRLAPNLQVARADANQYAISARGMNSVLANKMLVLIDGRTVYSPLFSGVFWDAQDVPLADVDRIEVISGPGGTLWGTNAVNGVINIITRRASDTPGTLVEATAGNAFDGALVRQGFRLGSDAWARVYGGGWSVPHTTLTNGRANADASSHAYGGFRADWATAGGSMTLQGDGAHANIDQQPANRKVFGGDVLARWTRPLADTTTSVVIQTYYDHQERDQPGAIHDVLNTFDVDFQHGFRPWGGHSVLWGANYRHHDDMVQNLNPAALALIPDDRKLDQGGVFVQDVASLAEPLDLIAGVKLEHNVYTGAEVLPNVRLSWRPRSQGLLWGAVSRAVRAPSRVDREFFSPGVAPHFIVAGGPNFESEIANVVEAGWRDQPRLGVSYSVTVFHNEYDRLRSLEPTPDGPQFENRIEGHNTGVELWFGWRLAGWWRLDGGWTQQDEELRLAHGSANVNGIAALGNDPRHWGSLRSSMDLGRQVELDLTVRNSGALPNPQVPAYTTLDGRAGWNPRADLTLAVTGQNLVGPTHPEWGVPAARIGFERYVAFEVQWRH